MRRVLWFGLFLGVLGVAWPPTVPARLGETLEECRKRYGAPAYIEDNTAARDGKRYYWEKGAFKLAVMFGADGRAWMMVYTPLQKDQQLSEPLVTRILEANSQGREWSGLSDGDTRLAVREDGGVAQWNTPRNTLLVMSPEGRQQAETGRGATNDAADDAASSP